MKYLGEYTAGKTIDFKFTTVDSSGEPATLSGTPAISIYKGNDTTQTTTGVTLTVDFDSVTGLNHVRIVTSDAFYVAGEHYEAVITTGTVDSVSVVGYVVGHFTLSKQAALRPTTADRTLDVTATGAAGVDWSNVENQSAAVALSNTDIRTAGNAQSACTAALNAYDPPTDTEMDSAFSAMLSTVTTVQTNILAKLPAALVGGRMDSSVGAMVTDAITAAALSAAAVAKIEAALLNEGDGQALIDAIVQAIDAADIENDVLPALIRDAILNRVLAGNHDTAGSVGKVLQDAATQASVDDLPTNAELTTALGTLNDLDATEVQTAATAALNAYDPPTKAELDSGFAGLNDLSAAQVNAEVDSALADYDAPTKAELDSGLAGLSIPTAAANADAVWAEVIAAHVGSGTAAKYLRVAGSATGGKLSGAATTTNTIRDLEDGANAITATVDEDGNRTAVTYG